MSERRLLFIAAVGTVLAAGGIGLREYGVKSTPLAAVCAIGLFVALRAGFVWSRVAARRIGDGVNGDVGSRSLVETRIQRLAGMASVVIGAAEFLRQENLGSRAPVTVLGVIQIVAIVVGVCFLFLWAHLVEMRKQAS
jgi:hypothetical protein